MRRFTQTYKVSKNICDLKGFIDLAPSSIFDSDEPLVTPSKTHCFKNKYLKKEINFDNLIKVLKENDLDSAKFLIEQIDPQKLVKIDKLHFYKTPLSYAIQTQALQRIVPLLVKKMATSKKVKGMLLAMTEALIESINSDNLESAKLLITELEGEDVLLKGKKGYKALLAAIDRGHIEIIKLLIEKIDPQQLVKKEDWYEMPISYAIQKQSLQSILPLFVKKMATSKKVKGMLLAMTEALIESINSDNLESAKLLITELEGEDVLLKGQKGYKALLAAIDRGHIEIITLLIEKIDPQQLVKKEDWYEMPISYAIQKQSLQSILPLFVKKMATSKKVKGMLLAMTEALIESINSDNLESAKLLITELEGEDVLLKGQKGYKALLAAIDRGHIEIITLLIEKIDPQQLVKKEDWYEMPISYAIQKQSLQSILPLFVKKMATSKKVKGMLLAMTEALIESINSDNLESAKLLITELEGEDVLKNPKVKSMINYIELLEAIKEAQDLPFEVLLEQIDSKLLTVKDFSDKNALLYAIEKDNSIVSQLIIKKIVKGKKIFQ